ncbi:MAG: hypothetical protein Q8L66_02575 [Caulobacter sp.]|nr:hypothetical protein [Caulobacter sp.]
MKLHLFASAAVAAAAFAVPAFAADAVGSVGLSAAHTELEVGPFDGQGEAYTLDGSVAFQTAPNWTVSLAGAVVTSDEDLGDDSTFSGMAHLTYAAADWRLGGFVGAGEASDETLWSVGGVAQKYIGNVTLSGAVGYGKIDDLDADLWGARADVRYFVSDTFSLNGGLGLTRIDVAGGDADVWSIGAGGEYQFAGTPWSIFGGYEHNDANDLDLTADTVKLGVRVNFGGDLKARDRSGADLGAVSGLFGGVR